MKKVWTTLIMFSLFFLFSFSYAATATITVIDRDGVEKVYEDTDDALSSNASITFDLRNYDFIGNYTDYLFYRRDNFVYQFMFFNNTDGVTFYYDDSALHGEEQTLYSVLVPVSSGVQHNFGSYAYLARSPSSTKFSYNEYLNHGLVYAKSAISFKILDASVSIYRGDFAGTFVSSFDPSTMCVFTDELVFEAGSGSVPPLVMENPLTDEELKSIIDIFSQQMKNTVFPDGFNRFYIQYDVLNNRYFATVYSQEVSLLYNYLNYDPGYDLYTDSEKNHGEYYVIFSADEKPFDFYYFYSNEKNTYFDFIDVYSINLPSSTVNLPVIYTSHDISLVLYKDDETGEFVYDKSGNLLKSEIIVDINNSFTGSDTDSSDKNVNLITFVGLLFSFVFSVISFLVNFFEFIITFIIVPASTNILPDGIVQGIDWLHSFAFGEILLWDIFSIIFGILLAFYIVGLIRSSSH